MPYDNNNLTEDTDAQHAERAHTMGNGIGDHGEDLLFTPAEITEMQEYPDEFDAALSVQIEEAADVDAAYVGLRARYSDMEDKYVSCQDYIRGEKLLRKLYHRAVSLWGDDDPRFFEIGLVPKSAIGTPSEPEPGMPKYPDAVEELNAWINELDLITIDWAYGKDEDVTFNLYKAEVKIGDPAPDRPAVPWQSGVDGKSFTDNDLKNNRAYYYWVVAVKDGVEGEFAAPVVIEYKPE